MHLPPRLSSPLRGLLLPLALAALLPACVTRERYDTLAADATKVRAEAAACASQGERDRAAAARAREQAALAEAELRRKLEGAEAMNAAMDAELRKQGTNVDALLKERGQFAREVEEARAALSQLQRARAAADARAALYRDLALRFQRMIDAGSLRVALRDGRMMLVLSNDVLFDSGRVELKQAGRDALAEIAAVLATIPDRHFQVAGHTDTVPINTARFPSNWELSTGRAVEVTRFLIGKGVAPGELSAAGYGEFDPVASNDTTEGKARNRRIEITVVPSIDEMVKVPQP
jgi:chemotaxis protein MotB